MLVTENLVPASPVPGSVGKALHQCEDPSLAPPAPIKQQSMVAHTYNLSPSVGDKRILGLGRELTDMPA